MHQPPTNRSFYLSLAASTLRFAIIVALVIGGIVVIDQAFPALGDGDGGGGGGGATAPPTGGTLGGTGGTDTTGPTGATATGGTGAEPSPTVVGVRIAVFNGAGVERAGRRHAGSAGGARVHRDPGPGRRAHVVPRHDALLHRPQGQGRGGLPREQLLQEARRGRGGQARRPTRPTSIPRRRSRSSSGTTTPPSSRADLDALPNAGGRRGHRPRLRRNPRRDRGAPRARASRRRSPRRARRARRAIPNRRDRHRTAFGGGGGAPRRPTRHVRRPVRARGRCERAGDRGRPGGADRDRRGPGGLGRGQGRLGRGPLPAGARSRHRRERRSWSRCSRSRPRPGSS